MTALTTRQRDVLRLLVKASAPQATSALAAKLQLTPRQVNYSLKGVQPWLAQHSVVLSVTPGVGAELQCSEEELVQLGSLLDSDNTYQLVLSPGQRQQLFLFQLLTSQEPLILYQLKQRSQVSRTTILKDLDSAEPWLERFGLTLERRPNYGIEVCGPEKQVRQALVGLLWGDAHFGDPLWSMTHNDGLVFALRRDVGLLPILQQVASDIDKIDPRAAFTAVAQAEASIGGRFSDEGVLHLALLMAVQRFRVTLGKTLSSKSIDVGSVRTHPIWPSAYRIASAQLRALAKPERDAEVASIAANLLGSPRNDRWPGDVESEARFGKLIAQLMRTVSEAYKLPDLLADSTLQNGLIAHVIPACLRQQYGLWSPPQMSNRLQEAYAFELSLADKLSNQIAIATGARLPDNEVNNLALLIRAAYVRERPNRLQRVVVVCPSGMATAQLLTARLKARFPRMGTLHVLSMRELSEERLDSAELILTTIPLPPSVTGDVKVIQVHPLLLPEDIETITTWLA